MFAEELFKQWKINKEHDEGNIEEGAFNNDLTNLTETLLYNYKIMLLRIRNFEVNNKVHDGLLNNPQYKKVKKLVNESISRMEGAIATLFSIYKDKPYESNELKKRVEDTNLLDKMVLFEQIIHFSDDELKRITQFINWYIIQRIRELDGEEAYQKAMKEFIVVEPVPNHIHLNEDGSIESQD